MKINEKELNELVLTELSECCHMDYIEDYKTELDFYLSSVSSDSYTVYIGEKFPSLNDDDLEDIRELVIDKIKVLNEFINNFVEGIEMTLWETDSTTNYVDCELEEHLGVEEVDNEILEFTINEIVKRLNNLGYDSSKISCNEITTKKIFEGTQWGDLTESQKKFLLKNSNAIDGITGNNFIGDGECVIDLTDKLSVLGEVIDDEIYIYDKAIIYNCCD